MTGQDRSQERLDRMLLDAIVAFALGHVNPHMRRFRAAVTDWGAHWLAVEPILLPAAGFLERTAMLANPDTRALIELFLSQRARVRWSQSYKRRDGLVGDDMLSAYGYVEVLGPHGPFVSERVRGGLGVLGPSIDYPVHRHQAEEVYAVLGGSADFTVAGRELAGGPGDVIYVSSGLPHGIATTREPLAVFYLWQAGDLTETPSFI